jgi:hypothetical protein
VKFVLGSWSPEEKKFLEKRIELVIEMIRSFGTIGTELTMTTFNKAGKITPEKDIKENNTGDKLP